MLNIFDSVVEIWHRFRMYQDYKLLRISTKVKNYGTLSPNLQLSIIVVSNLKKKMRNLPNCIMISFRSKVSKSKNVIFSMLNVVSKHRFCFLHRYSLLRFKPDIMCQIFSGLHLLCIS